MKKLILFLAAAAAFLACTKDFEADDGSSSGVPYAGSEYTIPPQEALVDLEAVLSELYGVQTRTGAPKTVGRLSVVSMGGQVTRSGVDTTAVPLLYIADFEGGGYAIVGADRRVGGVIAIAEQGKLTAADFGTQITVSSPPATDPGNIDEQDYDDYSDIYIEEDDDDAEWENSVDVNAEEFTGLLADFAYAYAYERVVYAQETLSQSSTPTRSTSVADWTWDGKVWKTTEMIQSKCLTVWKQGAPFNNNISTACGKTVVAGCGAIALSQICAYQRFPAKSQYGVSYPWSAIRRVYSYYSGPEKSWGSYNDQEWASYLVACVGIAAKTKYGSSNSSVKDKNVAKAMSRMGYRNVSVRKRRNTNIDDNVRVALRSGNPVYYRGERKTGWFSTSGHAWVVDGLWRIYSGSEKMNLVHCNFGWGGTHNGWYREGMFNTSRNMVSYSLTGDTYAPDDGAAGRDYRIRQRAITYTKPN